jgi:hypothetical protein
MPQTLLHIIPIATARPFFTARSLLNSINFVSFFFALGFELKKVKISMYIPHCHMSSVLPIPTNTSTPSLLLLPYPKCLKFIVLTSFLPFLVIFFRVQVKKK